MDTTASIGSLTPDTEYVFTLFSSRGGSFISYGSPGTFSTLENLEANHDLSDFQDSATGVTDLSSLDTNEIEILDEHLNELLDTGDLVVQNTVSGSTQTTFIKRGDTLDSTSSGGVGSFSIPFTASAGSGQVATIITGTSDIVVSYDDTTDQVVVDGTSYNSGDSLVVDGKNMIVYNL